jgi:hypothetical protein
MADSIYESLKRFEQKYAALKKLGLRVNGLILLDPKRKIHAIDVSRPLVFDSRLLPKRFEGLTIKAKIHGDLPEEFQVDREKKEFIWAPERFERFVDRCGQDIRVKLNNPAMDRSEMLSALCFGDFEEHRSKVMQWVKEGKIPAYSEN